MKEFRKGKNCTEHYTSFEEAAAAWNCKPVIKRTKNEEKLKAQREKFLGTCKVCKSPLSIISGTNVLACQNENCKGIPMKGTNEDGSEKIWYVPVSRTLDEKGFQISLNLFD